MIIFNSNVLKFGGFWLGFGSSPTPPQPTIYRINVPPTVEHGTVSVNPTEGPTGTLVTISTVPDTGYELDTISLTGAELINGNQFYIDGSDVTVNVTFRIDTNLPPYTLRLRFTDGFTPTNSRGTLTQVSASPNIWDWTYNERSWMLAWKNNNSLLEVIDGNTADVMYMDWLFERCTSLTSVSLFNTSNVIEMTAMFVGCASLTSVPLFDTSNVTDMNVMFDGCTSLTSVPLFDTSNVTTMNGMFDECTSLTSVPLFDTSKVTDMKDMFDECTSLTSVPLFDTSKVTDMEDMFYGCTSLTSVPLFDTSNATRMFAMFAYCTSLTSVPLFNTSKVTDMSYMFSGCYKVESGALALYQQASSQATPPSSHASTFNKCGRDTVTGAAELAQIPSDWK